jgi:hypothetical protein
VLDVVLAVLGLYSGLVLSWVAWLATKLDKAKESASHYKEAYGTLKTVVDRFGMVTDMTKAVLAATRDAGATVSPPGGEPQ